MLKSHSLYKLNDQNVKLRQQKLKSKIVRTTPSGVLSLDLLQWNGPNSPPIRSSYFEHDVYMKYTVSNLVIT